MRHRAPGSRGGGVDPVPAPALLLSRDHVVIEHVRALAEAAGAVLEVQPTPTGNALRSTPLILIGLDVAGELPPGWRGGVLVVEVAGADAPEGVWRRAVELGTDRVVLLPESEAWLLEQLIEVAQPTRRAPTVAVVGGCGGAGASALAIALAGAAAAAHLEPTLVDADPFGGGLDLALGAEQVPGLRWPELPQTSGRLPAGLIRTGLPLVAGVRVLAWARDDASGAAPATGARLPSVVDAAARESDLVVVDLPRWSTPAQPELLAGCRQVLLVVPAHVRAVAAATQVAARLQPWAGDLRLVVRGPSAPGLTAETVADVLELPLAGQLRPEPGLTAAFDRGEAAALRRGGPLAVLARRLVTDLRASA